MMRCEFLVVERLGLWWREDVHGCGGVEGEVSSMNCCCLGRYIFIFLILMLRRFLVETTRRSCLLPPTPLKALGISKLLRPSCQNCLVHATHPMLEGAVCIFMHAPT